MPVKLTMAFRANTVANSMSAGSRAANWTESHYVNVDTIAAAEAAVRNPAPAGGGLTILERRAALLGGTAQLRRFYLQRFALVNGHEEPDGGREEFRSGIPGPIANTVDIPQQGILIQYALVGNPQMIRFIIRGVPNLQVRDGELQLQPVYRQALNFFIRGLEAVYGTFIDNRIGAAGIGRPIQTVSVAGVVTGFAPIGILAVNQLAKVSRTRNSNNALTGGVYRVGTVDGGAGTVTLPDWDRGATTGGTIRLWERVFAAYQPESGAFTRQATRKVGTERDYRGSNRRVRS